jgi:hypothetical protein
MWGIIPIGNALVKVVLAVLIIFTAEKSLGIRKLG